MSLTNWLETNTEAKSTKPNSACSNSGRVSFSYQNYISVELVQVRTIVALLLDLILH